MLRIHVNHRTELRLLDHQHTLDLLSLFNLNRTHLRQWHPWVDAIRNYGDVERLITTFRQQHALNRGFHAGIWFDGRLCGAINHLTVDWTNRFTLLSYWLDADHQGQGIMTNCCRAVILHAFEIWKLNRVTIECAVDNTRSRAIPERLGFKLEGISRAVEKLHGRHVDHAIYGLLNSEFVRTAPAAKHIAACTGKTVVA